MNVHIWSLPQSTNPRNSGLHKVRRFLEATKTRSLCDEDTPRISFVDKAIVMTVHRDLNVVNTPETYAGADVNKRVFCFHGFALREKQHRIRYGAQRVQHTRYTASLLIRPSPNALIHFAEAMQRNTQAR
jgi:hypothetical protein